MKKRKSKVTKSQGREKTKRNTSLTLIGFWLTLIGLIISVSFNIHQCAIQQPKIEELARIKRDFPMVQNIYEAIVISKAIPLPEPLETTKNLDYFPTVLLNTSQDPTGYFESAPYGYVLRLNTGLNTYLATDSPENSTEKRVVFSMGELREKRKILTWFLYEDPFPPEGWTTFK